MGAGRNSIIAILLVVLFSSIGSCADNNTNTAKKVYRTRYFEQHTSELNKEGHRKPQFSFVLVNTKIKESWDDLPSRANVKLSEVNGTELCPVYFHVNLTGMGQPNDLKLVDICIAKETGAHFASDIFTTGGNIDFFGEVTKSADFLDELSQVTGYVHGFSSSLVNGYLVEGFFYGTIRIFDKLRRYHIHYYIEPISNAVLYSEKFYCKGITAEQGKNAILFEYIPHEDYLNESARAACNSSKINRNVIAPMPISNWTEQTQGAHFMKENMFHDDLDIMEVKAVAGSSNSPIFDLRVFDTLICEICVWIQPNFAENFGLGPDNIKQGVAEAISIFRLTNQILRSQDFNDDGMSENIGIHIKKLIVTDKISAIKLGGTGLDSEKNISRTVNTINAKEALRNMEESMNAHGQFHDCCAKIGLIFHNMAPSVTASSIGGICSLSNNSGLVSGYEHIHKLGYFDVFRGLMHVFGQLLGGSHDVVSEAYCYKSQEPRTEFRDEYPLHPIQLLNLGLRPKSLTFSPCSKDDITKFLTSKGPSCFKKEKDAKSFCGNGVREVGEECDCGSIRDCHLRHACCGESDSVMGCRIVISGKRRCFQRSSL